MLGYAKIYFPYTTTAASLMVEGNWIITKIDKVQIVHLKQSIRSWGGALRIPMG